MNGQFVRPLREQFEKFKEIKTASKWFKVYQLPQDVLAICEPYHREEVISYLILGSEMTLLWDTGMGVDSMKELIEELCDKPYIVLNSHTHFDHIGSNCEFENVLVYDHPQSSIELTCDIEEGWGSMFKSENIAADAPKGYVNERLRFRRCNYTRSPLRDFQLGERKLQWIKGPGHTADHTMFLVDEKYKLVFVADAYYSGLLYAFSNGNLKDYSETMFALVKNYPNYTMVCSHNEPFESMDKAEETASMLDEILRGVIKPTKKDIYISILRKENFEY